MSDAPMNQKAVLELKGIRQSFPEAGGGRLDVIKENLRTAIQRGAETATEKRYG